MLSCSLHNVLHSTLLQSHASCVRTRVVRLRRQPDFHTLKVFFAGVMPPIIKLICAADPMRFLIGTGLSKRES